MIDPQSPTPLYIQIADELAARITSGQLLPHRPIPSEATLRQEFGVSRGTVRRAVAELRQRGLIFTVTHRGSYVGRRPE